MQKKKKIFIVAGEASGDIIGANLIKSIGGSQYEIYGIGGDMMKDAGVKILFHFEKIAIIGLFEVLLNSFKLIKYMKQTIAEIIQYKPDLIITIDSPGFNFRIIKSLRNLLTFKAIHYVAPSVWAYGANRAQLVSNLYDHILLILPFEREYFTHMPHTFVGHPIVEDNSCLLRQISTEEVFMRDKTIFNSKDWIITIMPGSRKSEIKKHITTLIATIQLLRQHFQGKQNIKFIFLTLPHLKNFLTNYMKDFSDINVMISSDVEKHNEIIQSSILGIVKSGTATMRFMANATPAITFYKVSPITAWIIRMKLKITKFNLCNIIMKSDILPECIQENFTTNNLFKECIKLISNYEKRLATIKLYLQVWQSLQQDEKPSIIAANIISKYL
jgi:lipid-A-disaccharide synthase